MPNDSSSGLVCPQRRSAKPDLKPATRSSRDSRIPGRPTRPASRCRSLGSTSPAIGAIALLGAWLVTRIPGREWRAGLTSTVVITAFFALGVWAFHAMYEAFGVPLNG